jgi:Type II secretion system (T2SS), protein M subtype b
MSLVGRIFTEKRRFIYPLVGAVVLNAAIFAALVYPLSLKVANGERDANAAAAALAAARADYESVRAMITGKADADSELKKFYGAVLPPDYSAARRLLFGKIDSLAAETGVKVGSESTEPSQERGSELGKLTASVVLFGDYRNIRRFIHQLETAQEFLVLENVALSQAQEREQGLTVMLRLATYFRES